MATDTTHQHQVRLDLGEAAPQLYKAMIHLDTAVRRAGLDETLLHLVKMRASQINGCAYCLDMHSKDARKAGETEQRLYGLNAWREAPYYTDRERAALDLTESLTLIADGGVPDDVWERAAGVFDEAELGALVFANTVINGWNRIAISTRIPPGSYEA
jgi:AhpD family alkylhydroperoxidase